MRAQKVKWFTGIKGKVGIAKVLTDDGDIEYRISVVDGFLEHMDMQQVVAWGAYFPHEAGDPLFMEDA
jgi:hypothetical protein